MAQRDYILRLIEQMGAVLAELRRAILGRTRDDTKSERAETLPWVMNLSGLSMRGRGMDGRDVIFLLKIY